LAGRQITEDSVTYYGVWMHPSTINIHVVFECAQIFLRDRLALNV
jgi:hypothetical protein